MFGHATYLVFELAWGVPVLLLQWIAGGHVLWHRRRAWAICCLLPTLYLWAADDYAIAAGIWSINPARTLGLRPLGLPIEEAIFFLLTNLMVVQTVMLVRWRSEVWLLAALRRRLLV
jgi:lycopene cyclase domain-containing protein